MKAIGLAFLTALCACRSQPTMIIGDGDRMPYVREDDNEERRARQELAAIERKVERGDLPKIQFEFDKDEITPESYPTLNLVAELLLRNPRLKIFCLAHTDSVGTAEYNLDLSQRRAKAVKGYLVKRGVYPPSIRFKGLGYSMPLADNSTDEGRAKNRRVEFRVTYRDWETVY
jgi:outer membrane protein OmpA-like peptidoglycan-associated protein